MVRVVLAEKSFNTPFFRKSVRGCSLNSRLGKVSRVIYGLCNAISRFYRVVQKQASLREFSIFSPLILSLTKSANGQPVVEHLSPNLAKPFLLDPVQGDVIGERGIKTENIAAVSFTIICTKHGNLRVHRTEINDNRV